MILSLTLVLGLKGMLNGEHLAWPTFIGHVFAIVAGGLFVTAMPRDGVMPVLRGSQTIAGMGIAALFYLLIKNWSLSAALCIAPIMSFALMEAENRAIRGIVAACSDQERSRLSGRKGKRD